MLDLLHISQGGVPIYVQLREQLLQAVGSGLLAPGAQLPTMRQVAVTLRVDLNTVQRAYAELERAGVVETVRGRGTFVAARPPPLDDAVRQAKVEALVQETIGKARANGLAPEEIGRRILEIANRSGRDHPDSARTS